MKKIFITGGTSGIGQSFAKYYSANGFKVGVCGGPREHCEDFLNQHPDIEFFELDVTSRTDCVRVIKDFVGQDKLHKLILCAGLNDGKPHRGVEIDFDRSEKIISVNVQGVLNSIEGAYEQLTSGSQIVVMSSAAGLSGFPSAPAYVASKSALMTLCESLNIRFKAIGVSVTCIMPGYIDTPLARSTHPKLEKMPFMLTLEQALPMMIKAIEKKRSRYVFPWQIWLLGIIFQLMPRFLFERIYSKVENSSIAGNTRNTES
jgi:short-subunit dehydrogenase